MRPPCGPDSGAPPRTVSAHHSEREVSAQRDSVRRRLGLLVAVAVLALGACSGDGSADAPDAGTPPATATPTPSVTPTTPPASEGPDQPSATPTVGLDDLALAYEVVATDLVAPVLALPRPGTSEVWVVEQPGRIQALRPDGTLDMVVDLQDRVAFGGERGLLGLAFAPDHDQTGRFVLHYSAGGSGATRVEAWTIEDGRVEPDHAVLELAQPAGNHNGGMVMFGPDGMLYVGLGDGGGGGDTYGNGQRADTLLGTILRLDFAEAPYRIPADNPFVGGRTPAGDPAAPEVWAYGLRNPWRFWIDDAGDGPARMVIGDVGQNAVEEVDVLDLSSDGGANLGWPIREGARCFRAETCATDGFVEPVTSYPHDDGCSIAGGITYRGPAIPALAGHWFYSDYCSGFLRSIALDAEGRVTEERDWTAQVGVAGRVLSFGLDQDGELLVLTADGTIRRLVAG